MFTFIKLHALQGHPAEKRPLEIFLQPNPGMFMGMAEAVASVEDAEGQKKEILVTQLFLTDGIKLAVQETPEQVRAMCEQAMNQEIQMLTEAQRNAAQSGLLVPQHLIPPGQVSGRRGR